MDLRHRYLHDLARHGQAQAIENILDTIDQDLLGIDADRLLSIAKAFSTKDSVAFGLEANFLTATAGRKVLKSALVDTTGMADPKLPHIPFLASAFLACKDLLSALSDYISFCPFLYLTISDEGLHIQTRDQASEMMRGEQVVTCGTAGSARGLYACDILHSLIEPWSPLSCTVRLGDGLPLQVTFENGDSVMLAPLQEDG